MQTLVFRNSKDVEINLTEGNYFVVNWNGLSNVGQELQTQKVPFVDGSVYLDNLLNERELSFTVALNDEKDLAKRYELRRELISVLNPKLGEGYLIYENDYLSKQIKVIPDSPIIPNKNFDEGGTIKCELVFTACSPYWEDLEETSVNLVDSVIIDNDGDIETPVKIEVKTENVKNLLIENLSTNKKIAFDEMFDSFEVNTNFGHKEVKELKKDIETVAVDYDEETGLAIATNGDIILSVSPHGNMIYSYDGENWFFVNYFFARHTSISSSSVNNVMYNSKEGVFFCGVNREGFVSKNGLDWEEVSLDFTIVTVRVDDSLGKFIVCSNEKVYTSANGKNWDYVSANINLKSVCYSKELRLYVGIGTDNSIYSSTNMITWTKRYNNTNTLKNCIFIPSLQIFISVGIFIAISYDGINWITKNSNSYTMFDVVYSKDKNILITYPWGDIGQRIYVSYDGGENWAEVQMSAGTYIYNVKLNKFFVINPISHSGIYSSVDGINWEVRTFDSSELLTDTMYIESLGLYIGVSKNKIYYSVDGINWTERKYNAYVTMQRIRYDDVNNLIFVMGDPFEAGRQRLYYSSDGINWNETNQAFFNDVNYSALLRKYYGFRKLLDGALYFGISDENNIGSWSENQIRPASAGGGYTGIIYSDRLGMFFIVGENLILKSTDGNSWNEIAINCRCREIVEFKNLLFICGVYENKGVLFVSNDGVNFTLLLEDEKNIFTRFKITENSITLYGRNSGFYESTDGLNWNKKDFNKLSFNTFIKFSDGSYEFFLEGVVKTKYSSTESINYISKLKEGSDINFNLVQGENKLKISYSEGVATATIKYKNKYIGV